MDTERLARSCGADVEILGKGARHNALALHLGLDPAGLLPGVHLPETMPALTKGATGVRPDRAVPMAPAVRPRCQDGHTMLGGTKAPHRNDLNCMARSHGCPDPPWKKPDAREGVLHGSTGIQFKKTANLSVALEGTVWGQRGPGGVTKRRPVPVLCLSASYGGLITL